MRVLIPCSLFIALAGLALAAPAKKEKSEPLGPPTEEQLATAEKNLKIIALAWHNYEATNGNLPGDILDNKGKPLLSWRVAILPFLEDEDGLYRGFKLDEPWDSENNKKLIDAMPMIFEPIRVKSDKGLTFYQTFTGKHGLMKAGQKLTFGQIADGSSNTFMVAEAAKPVIWSKPGDLEFDGKNHPALGGLFDGKFHAAMCDGSVGRFKKDMDKETLGRLIDPSDGNSIDFEAARDK